MTISGALTNALSGLRAAGRGAEVVSSNISNALTPGYGRRVLELSSASINGSDGVRIGGITRIVDESIVADKRLAMAEQANMQSTAQFFERLENSLGTPDLAQSLTARLSEFEGALITASSRPDAPERLRSAVSAASDLAKTLSDTSKDIQTVRTAADRTISQQVDQLNTALEQVVSLNAQITATQVQGGDVAALQDMRQGVVDTIGVLVPVRQVPRDNGQVALYTTGGAILLDGTAAKLEFEASNVVTPYMSVDSNTLSGLTINSTAVRTGSDNGALRGGAIGAQFAIRDELGVSAQTQIDAIARDLVERFQDPAVDPSLSPGDAGLFTDSGGPFDPLNERGLSSRLELNARVDPDQGGETWRIRDGMNTLTPGVTGDASILLNLGEALSSNRVPASGGFGSGAFSAIDLVATVTSDVANRRTISEQQLSYASARLTELTERQLADGVDTDAEIQRLLLIEQSYAANARMIEAADEMMQTILRL
ncbi:MAG: flagellar hook-associated protein FlgK [Sulfitobacter sp.]